MLNQLRADRGFIVEINTRAEKNERVLVTTLTKKMAEDLTTYLENMGVRVSICTMI